MKPTSPPTQSSGSCPLATVSFPHFKSSHSDTSQIQHTTTLTHLIQTTMPTHIPTLVSPVITLQITRSPDQLHQDVRMTVANKNGNVDLGIANDQAGVTAEEPSRASADAPRTRNRPSAHQDLSPRSVCALQDTTIGRLKSRDATRIRLRYQAWMVFASIIAGVLKQATSIWIWLSRRTRSAAETRSEMLTTRKNGWSVAWPES